MKKIIAIAAVLVFALSAVPAFAGSTANVPISASITSQLELAATVYQGNVGGPVVTSMDFGALVNDTPNGALRADDFYTVFLTSNSSGRKYTVKETSSAPTNGTNSLEAGACIVTPHANGATLPTGSTLGTRGSFVATDKVIYTSEDAGSLQSVAAAFAITNDPANGATEFIPADKQGGNYTSNATFTLTLV